MSIQRTHVHLLVEAESAEQLAKGMQGFQVSAAKRINRELGGRRGNVFVDRYHAVIVRSPRQVRNALAYVLNNWRKHGEDRDRLIARWPIDLFSTAFVFDGWAERPHSLRMPSPYEPLVVVAPRTWLLVAGWTKAAPISMFEVPAATRPR